MWCASTNSMVEDLKQWWAAIVELTWCQRHVNIIQRSFTFPTSWNANEKKFYSLSQPLLTQYLFNSAKFKLFVRFLLPHQRGTVALLNPNLFCLLLNYIIRNDSFLPNMLEYIQWIVIEPQHSCNGFFLPSHSLVTGTDTVTVNVLKHHKASDSDGPDR